MTNAEWMIKNGYKFSGLCAVYEAPKEAGGQWTCHIQHLIAGIDEISDVACINVLTNWLDAEHKEPILDESERQYLSAVIKPFRDHVRYICKGVYESGTLEKKFQFIKISIGNSPYDLIMPGFAPYTIYQGMELNKEYTLEELGL